MIDTASLDNESTSGAHAAKRCPALGRSLDTMLRNVELHEAGICSS